jgi:hypothetical protein
LASLPCPRVAEKTGDADHQVAYERRDFIGACAQLVDVLVQCLDVPETETTVNAPPQRRVLVAAKIVSAPNPQEFQ